MASTSHSERGLKHQRGSPLERITRTGPCSSVHHTLYNVPGEKCPTENVRPSVRKYYSTANLTLRTSDHACAAMPPRASAPLKPDCISTALDLAFRNSFRARRMLTTACSRLAAALATSSSRRDIRPRIAACHSSGWVVTGHVSRCHAVTTQIGNKNCQPTVRVTTPSSFRHCDDVELQFAKRTRLESL